jgi:hypothetical protein
MLFLHKSALLYRYPIVNEHSYYFKSVKTIEGSARKLQIKQKKKSGQFRRSAILLVTMLLLLISRP